MDILNPFFLSFFYYENIFCSVERFINPIFSEFLKREGLEMKSTEEMEVLEEGFDEIDPDEDKILDDEESQDSEKAEEEDYSEFSGEEEDD